MYCIGMFMMSLNPVILTFPIERLVFLREENSKMYNVTAYYIAKNIVETPLLLFTPLISAIIDYFMIGFNISKVENFFIFALIGVAQSLNGNALGKLYYYKLCIIKKI